MLTEREARAVLGAISAREMIAEPTRDGWKLRMNLAAGELVTSRLKPRRFRTLDAAIRTAEACGATLVHVATRASYTQQALEV